MASEWRLRRLDELGFVGRGKSRHRPRNDERLYGGPYPFVQTADIMAADPYITSYSQTYNEFGLEQSKMWGPNTLCMTIAGANTARTAILKIEACFPDSVVGFVADKTKADLHFVKYSLDLMRNKFLAVSRGATQDNLSLDKLLSFPLPVPDLEIQQRIGAVLSAYDDLIENNNRRIEILEEMAQMIYREWFVRLRFPGHENVRTVESEVGPIPQDWHLERLDNLAQITMGQSPPSEHYNNQGKGLPFHQGVTDFGSLFPENKTYCTLEQRIAEARDILLSVRAPVGRLNITLNKIVIGRGLCALRSKFNWQPLLFLQLRDYFRDEDSMGSGTIFKAVTKEDICGLKFLRPETDMGERFNDLIAPMFRELEVLSAKNAILRQTRDLLLPKLVSGEISVENPETVPSSHTP